VWCFDKDTRAQRNGQSANGKEQEEGREKKHVLAILDLLLGTVDVGNALACK
jgi:hypothetical protein